jgi:hypothetical protein
MEYDLSFFCMLQKISPDRLFAKVRSISFMAYSQKTKGRDKIKPHLKKQ